MNEEERSVDIISYHRPTWIGDLHIKELEILEANIKKSPMKVLFDRIYLRGLVGTTFTRLLFSYYELQQMQQHYAKSNVWALYTYNARQEDYDNYLLCMNDFDSFITKLYSSIQIMARLVFVVYKLNLKSDKIYFQNVKEQLQKHYEDTAITKVFAETSNTDWFQYLNKMRVRIEHAESESFILDSTNDKIYLQPEPAVSPYSQPLVDKYELKSTCEKLFRETTEFHSKSARELNAYLF